MSQHAILVFWECRLIEDAERDENARSPTVQRATKYLWMRVCLLKYDIGEKVAEMTVCRVGERHAINVHGGFASALDLGASQETRATMAGHANKRMIASAIRTCRTKLIRRFSNSASPGR